MNMADFLSRLKGGKPNGDGYLALCPGHNDHNQSLSITLKDGRILLYCHAGCSTEAIVERMGLTMSDLSPDGHKTKPEQKTPKKLVATFSYQDASGAEQFQIRRFEPKDFQVRHKNKSGEYVPGLGETKPIPYRLPELLQAIKYGKRVYLPEGEGKVDRLVALGLTATTSPFGAGPGKWLPEYNTFFTGAEIVNLADNDKVGQTFTQEKARNLYGVAKSVKVLLLPNLPPKGDVIDWLDAGGTPEQLEQLADTCPDYEPSDNGVKLQCMADVEPEAVSWLWKPYIPGGKLTLEEGDPGVGKSWASLAIASAVTRGKGLPGQESTQPANVVIASAEDGLGDTIRPRLDAMGADVNRIFAIDGALTLDQNGFVLLEAYLEKVRPALLIIDPLVAFLGAAVDIHRANEVRHVMAQLAKLAEKFDVAILAVRHLTKGGQLKPIYRGLGSIDFTAACRSVLLAGNDPDNPQKRGLVQIKSNLAPMGKAIGFELRDGGFYWTGDSDLTAARILAIEDSGEGKSARDEAADFLRDELADGPVEATQVWRDAREAGLSDITVKRAKAMLGVITRRQGETGKRGGGKFTWELPDLEGQKDLEYQGYHIEKNDTLNNSSLKSDHLPKTDDTLNTPEAVLGMPISNVLEIWRSEGAPLIHLGPGENCLDLEKLLSWPDVHERHLRAVKQWLERGVP